ncbi:MAG: ABC transporter substrate-binding protein [Lachnospiraceae bacterium]|nr:ABC transporter substrate-binding protein [Lachnospiraceae bacterium]
MKKKMASMVLVAAMAASMIGCGSSGTQSGSAASSSAPAASSAAAPAEASTESAQAGATESTDSSAAASTGTTMIQTATETGKSSDNDLVIAIEGSVSGLDPDNVTDTNGISACMGMYETLLTYDDNGDLTGKLAESYDVSDDNLTYTFHLRKGVKFHDGTDFTAQSVIDNINRVTDESNNLSRRRLFIATDADGKETNRIAKMEAKDDNTLVITLAQPYNVFLNKLTQFMIISPTALKKYGNDIMYHPCGTGPFIFKDRTEGDHTTMTANKEYWGGAPKVDSVTIKEVPEAGSRTAMLQTGEADMVYPFTSDQMSAVTGSNDINVCASYSNIMRYVTLNMNLKELSDVKVRQAMNYAIDKDAYVKVMYNGYALPATSCVPSCIQYYKEEPAYTYNLDKAKELMKEAGYENGFSLTLWGDNTTQEIKGMTFVQQELAQIGIKVDVQPMEPATVSDKIYVDKKDAKINMWYVNWSASDRSFDSSVRALLHSEMMPPTSANTAYYSNPDFDKNLDDALQETDETKLSELYGKCQDDVWNDCPWLFLGNDQILYATKGYVSGVSVKPDGQLDFANAVLAQ